jgi:hypothetical protein
MKDLEFLTAGGKGVPLLTHNVLSKIYYSQALGMLEIHEPSFQSHDILRHKSSCG